MALIIPSRPHAMRMAMELIGGIVRHEIQRGAQNHPIPHDAIPHDAIPHGAEIV